MVCLISLVLGLAQPPVAPRVAVVHSSWGSYAFRNEWDGHLDSLGWPYERFENTRGAELTARLAEFDLVISAGVGNLESPYDFAAESAAWRGWLEAGGALLITDASYDSVLSKWAGGLGDDSAIASAPCAPHTGAHGGSTAVTFGAGSPIAEAPVRLEPPFSGRPGIWAHLESWGSDWTSLATCADGRSLLLARDVGRGSAIVTSFYRFQGEVQHEAATGLLRNLWTHVQGLRSGIELAELDWGPPAVGPRTVRVALRSTTGAPQPTQLTLSARFGKEEAVELAALEAVAPSERALRVGLPGEIARRGPVVLSLSIAAEGRECLRVERPCEIPPPVTLSLARTRLSGERRELSADVGFSPPLGEPWSEASYRIDEVEVLRQSPAADGAVRFPTEGLALGAHTLSVEMRGAGGAFGSAEQPFSIGATPRVAVRANGVLEVAGEPLFPFGWYHVSWGFPEEHRLACLREIAAGGFNTLHASARNLDEWGPLLDEADRLGVRVITEFGLDPLTVIERYREHPAALAWNPGDEPDGQGVPPEVMAERARGFAALDPERPSFQTLCVPATYARYAGAADILAPDPYPIYRTGAETMPVYRGVRACRLAGERHDNTTIAILQCFGYPVEGPWRVPSLAECRNMTWLALLADAKGILYYTFADTGFSVLDHPELWEGMKTLPSQIRALEPWLLAGSVTELPSGSPEALAGAWEVDGQVLVLLANTSMDEAREVRVPLGDGWPTGLTPAFAGSDDGLRLEGGVLAGTLEPLGVRAVVLGR